MKTLSFAEEIDANKNAAVVPSATANRNTPASSLAVRLRGAFITRCELTSPSTARRVAVLYSDPDATQAKISATHTMCPAGPYDGIGGQHGFARWADYEEVPGQPLTLQAKRSDQGLGLSKKFVLGEADLTITAILTNPGEEPQYTSLGEHAYFALADGRLEGLKLNGQTLDELLGEGSEVDLQQGETLYYPLLQPVAISFPAGHSVRLSAELMSESKYPLAMWIWKRPGSPSICFEPVAGVKRVSGDDNRGLTLQPGDTAELRTTIEVL